MLQTGILIERIIQNLNYFREEIKSHSKLGLTNQHVHSELFLKKILNITYDLNLQSLNNLKSNFPGLDLGDRTNSIAYQITGDRSSKKINKTLKSILKEEHYKIYKTINVFVLSNKQKKYTINENRDNLIDFDINKNILDFDILFQDIKNLDLSKLEELDTLITIELPFLPNHTQQLNHSDYIPQLNIRIENEYEIELDDDEIEVYIMEIFHELKNNNMNFHSISVKEELFFQNKLDNLKLLDRTIDVRREIIEVKKILDYIAELKQEINDKIKIFYFTIKYPISDDYKNLTISLKEIINKLTYPSLLIEETNFLMYFPTKPKKEALKFNGEYKYDIYIDHKASGQRLGCSVWLTESEILEIKNKNWTFKKLNDKDFLHSIAWLSMLQFEEIDFSKKTITEKVIPSFVNRFYAFRTERYNFIDKEDFETWINLPNYKVSLG